MSFSHREERRDGRVLDVLTDDANGIRIVVSRLGAELVSVARRNARGEWIGFLYRDGELGAPEKGWANHATVMGYFLHRLKDGRSTYRGQPIEGGTHSFLRSKDWRLAEAQPESGSIAYEMQPGDFTEREYPLRVALTLSYAIEGEGIRTTFHFRNHEPELTAHVGFGLHPGFGTSSSRAERSGVEGSRGDTERAATGSLDFARDDWRFTMPRGLYRRHFSPTNYLSGETQDMRIEGGEMPFERAKLPGSYILEFVDVPDRTFTFTDPPTGRSVAIDLAGVPYMTLWSDGGPFLCVEPCWGLTDHEQQRAFEDKQGIQTIAPGGELKASFTMTPRLTD
jgi:galactose mutarotase-like enzyme